MLFRLQNLRKKFDRLTALDGISLEMDADAIGLLGPNGAGKSTLLKVLLGLLPLNSGSAEVLGMGVDDNAQAIRRAVGYMPEDTCFVPYMSAVDWVSYNGQLSGMPRKEAFRRAHEVLFFVGLEEARYRPLGDFSKGMKQRAKLAQAIVHGPKLLLLDEPTSGLDPQGRDEMLELVEDILARDIHVVLSTHLLPDVERVCDSVIMLNEGRLIHSGPISGLQQSDGHIVEVQTHLDDDALIDALNDENFEVSAEGDRIAIRLHVDQSIDDILRLAVERDIQLRHIMPEQLTLEAAFLQLLDNSGASPSSATLE